MGEQVQREVQSTFTAVDRSTGTLGKIQAATAGVASSVDKASASLAGIAGLAAAGVGALTLTDAVKSTLAYVGNVKRIATITGMATERADGMVEAFAKVGIETDEAARIMLSMSKSGAKLEMALAGGNAQAATLHGWMKSIGVDMKKGPESALMGLANAVQKHKVEVTDLMLRFRIPMAAAQDLQRFLKQGPDKIRATIDEISKSGMAVTPETITQYSNVKKITREIGLTWDRIKLTVGTQLLPVVSELLESGQHSLESWLPKAQAFGQAMGSFLRDHLGLVVKIGKVLLANAALAKITGTGAVGTAIKAAKWVRGSGPLIKPYVPKALSTFGRVFYKNKDMGFNIGTPGTLQKFQTTFGNVYAGAARLTPVLAMISKVALAGGGMLLAMGAFQGITDALQGKATYAGGKWREAFGYFNNMGVEAENIFGPEGTFMTFFANTAAWLASTGARYADKGSSYIAERWAARSQLGQQGGRKFLGMNWEQWKWDLSAGHTNAGQKALEDQRRLTEGIQRTDNAAMRLRVAKRAAEVGAPAEKAHNYVDMRYSKFDITNKFADGYDADRIAVGFVNKLASMGERRLQSGFAPLFTVR